MGQLELICEDFAKKDFYFGEQPLIWLRGVFSIITFSGFEGMVDSFQFGKHVSLRVGTEIS